MAKVSMNPAFLDKASYWVNLAYIASVCLTLVVSVVVVFISQQRAAIREVELKKVQSDSALQIAAANQTAASSNQHAAEANVVAAQAESKTAAATLAEEELRKQNLVLSVQLEQEKKLRLEVEERVAHEGAAAAATKEPARVLSGEQEQALAATLRRFAAERVSVVEIVDSEAGPLAQQIASALATAQWAVVVNRFGALVPPQYGIICTHTPTDKAAIALAETLRSFNLTVYERNAEASTQLEILIGLNGNATIAK